MMGRMRTRSLTDLETRILDFAEQHPRVNVGAVRSLIIREFGWKSATYVQRLNCLLDDPAAEAVRPMLIHRLRRLRDEQVNARRVALTG